MTTYEFVGNDGKQGGSLYDVETVNVYSAEAARRGLVVKSRQTGDKFWLSNAELADHYTEYVPTPKRNEVWAGKRDGGAFPRVIICAAADGFVVYAKGETVNDDSVVHADTVESFGKRYEKRANG